MDESKHKEVKILIKELLKQNDQQRSCHKALNIDLNSLTGTINSALSTAEVCNLTNLITSTPRDRPYAAGVILCLTLKKISKNISSSYIKFSFYLIRSLFVETKRRPKSILKRRCSKYISTLSTVKKLRIEKTLNFFSQKSVLKHFKIWENSLKTKKLKESFYRTKTIEKFSRAIEKVTRKVFLRKIMNVYLKLKARENAKILALRLKTVISHYLSIEKFSAFHKLKVLLIKTRRNYSYSYSNKLKKLVLKNIKKFYFE